MVIVYFGTLKRNAPLREGGEIIKLDWKEKKILNKRKIYPDDPRMDNVYNPRKSGQGCRGIEIYNDKIIAASYHTIHILDQSLNIIKNIRHILLTDIHEICLNGKDHLQVTSVGIDSVLEFNLKNLSIEKEYWPREQKEFQKALQISPLRIDKKLDNRLKYLGIKQNKKNGHLHLNATANWNGNVYALFNAYGIIANLSKNEIVIEDSALIGGHNLCFLKNGIAIANDTRGHNVKAYDIFSKKCIKTIKLDNYKWIMNLKRKSLRKSFYKIPHKILKRIFKLNMGAADPLFIRGLDVIGHNLYIGMSPAAIACIDYKTGEFKGGYCHSYNLRDCIHGLRVVKT